MNQLTSSGERQCCSREVGPILRRRNGDDTRVFWEIGVEYWRRDQLLSNFWTNGRLFITWVVWDGPRGVAISKSKSLGRPGGTLCFITCVRCCGKIMTFQNKKWKKEHYLVDIFAGLTLLLRFFRKIVIPRIY